MQAADKDGTTPVAYAAAAGQRGLMELLLEAGAEAEVRGAGGATPLLLAAGAHTHMSACAGWSEAQTVWTGWITTTAGFGQASWRAESLRDCVCAPSPPAELQRRATATALRRCCAAGPTPTRPTTRA